MKTILFTFTLFLLSSCSADDKRYCCTCTETFKNDIQISCGTFQECQEYRQRVYDTSLSLGQHWTCKIE